MSAQIDNDIIYLKKLLDDAESDDMLNDQAIKVKKRLDEEEKHANWSNNATRIDVFKEQKKAFDAVIADIRRRKHDRVLERYDRYCKESQINLVPWL